MSLKQEIETWVTALAAYDNNEFHTALRCFEQIPDTSKILFNRGVIHATLGEHDLAVQCYTRATQLDKFLAIAYFQQGVSNFLMGDFEEALANFNDALLYLRGHNNIAYEQLGLNFKLYSCEVLFNRGLCYIYLQQKEPGMSDLIYATREKMVPSHDVIDEAIREQAEGYTVFSIPIHLVFRPNEAKIKNLKMKDYLGKARLVAAQDQARQNLELRHQAALAAMSKDDIAQDKLSYAALNLVRSNVRSRQQSEPPLRRNIFPPTPPPELERPDSAMSSRRSAESQNEKTPTTSQSRSHNKPLRLELGAAAFDHRPSHIQQQPERTRLPTRRAESERPGIRREHSDSDRSHTSSHRRRGSGHHQHQPQPHHSTSTNETIPEVLIDPVQPYDDHPTNSSLRPSPLSIPHRRSRSSVPRAEAIEEDDGEEEAEGLTPTAYHQSSRTRRYEQPITPTNRLADDANDDAGSVLSPSDSTLVPLAFEIVQQPPALRARNPARTSSLRHASSAADASSEARTRESGRSKLASPISISEKDPFSSGDAAAREAIANGVAGTGRYSATSASSASTMQSGVSSAGRGGAGTELRKIRIKLHAEDMRYVMASPKTTFVELVDLVAAKLNLSAGTPGSGGKAAGFKLKIRDEEGDMVVMGDQDDWEMCVAGVRTMAAREGSEMGKVEVWVQET